MCVCCMLLCVECVCGMHDVVFVWCMCVWYVRGVCDKCAWYMYVCGLCVWGGISSVWSVCLCAVCGVLYVWCVLHVICVWSVSVGCM